MPCYPFVATLIANYLYPQNGLLRLRLLNASISRVYRLQLEQHPMHLIATDGGALSEPVEIEELLLTPGERAEVLIQGERPSGSYRLLSLPYDRGGMGMMGGGSTGGMQMGNGHSMSGMNSPSSTQADSAQSNSVEDNQQISIATLTYSDSPTEVIGLPAQLIPVEALPLAQNTRRIDLGMRMSFIRGMAFTLNGKTYNESRTDIEVPLGTVEEWEVANTDADMIDHPFHLHAAPFQVVSRNGQSEPYLAWKDTVLVKSGETVRLRVAFKDFANKSVYHCHILDHEELGMMGVINVAA
ncbi:MAG: multicopper oxidase domain-containing protein [Cyanobacteria bacterium P01_A01_bin.17]